MPYPPYCILHICPTGGKAAKYMLVRMTKELTEGYFVSVTKKVKGEDASFRGAFSTNDEIEIRLEAPRCYGVSSAAVRICADGGDDREIPFTRGADGAFILTLSGLSEGLYRYCIVMRRGREALYTDATDNVNFRLLPNSEGRRFRLLIYEEGYSAPDWFKGGVMYHIFVDRFAKSGRSPLRADACNEGDWYAPIRQYAKKPGDFLKNDLFYGGDLYGVAKKLDYLKKMGVTVIYLSPVFRAASNHKYDTGDYTQVDEAFGGNGAFEELLQAAEASGVRIILDGVFNHTGDDSLYFNKYGNYPGKGAYKNPDSPYRSWYSFGDTDDDYECWWGIKIHPRLCQGKEECRSYFCGRDGIGASYINKGISGWRLDVADELPDVFLDSFRESVKAADPEALIIGEVWENAADKVAYGRLRRYFRGRQLDSVMNYPFRSALLEFMRRGDGGCLAWELTDIYSSYPTFVCHCLMNIVGTHDTERILTALGDGEYGNMSNEELSERVMSDEERKTGIEKLRIAAAIQYTVYGVPSVFYGDEAGIEGGRDPFCRRTYPWGRENGELLSWYEKLGRLRADPVYKDGDFRVLMNGDGYIVFERIKDGRRLVTAANVGDKMLCTGVRGVDLLTGEKTDGETAPMSVCVIEAENGDCGLCVPPPHSLF